APAGGRAAHRLRGQRLLLRPPALEPDRRAVAGPGGAGGVSPLPARRRRGADQHGGIGPSLAGLLRPGGRLRQPAGRRAAAGAAAGAALDRRLGRLAGPPGRLVSGGATAAILAGG